MNGEHRYTAAITSTLAVVWVIGAAGIVMGTFASRDIAAGRAALWKASTCGLFEFDAENGGDADATVADLHDREKETRAAEYARSCYETRLASPGLQCDFFYNQTIWSRRYPEYRCPFTDKNVCINGTDGRRVVFDTMIDEKSRKNKDASVLGINVKKPYKFRRVTQCMPLSTEYPYVRNTTDQNGIKTFWYRHLQPIDSGTDWAYWTTGDPFDWHVPGYSVR